MILRYCLTSGTFSDDWKKANIVPVHKKNSKQLVNNYYPVSLLAMLKVFIKVIFYSNFEVLNGNGLLKSDQSEFTANDNCINQLVSIIRNIFKAFFVNLLLGVHSSGFDMKAWYIN